MSINKMVSEKRTGVSDEMADFMGTARGMTFPKAPATVAATQALKTDTPEQLSPHPILFTFLVQGAATDVVFSLNAPLPVKIVATMIIAGATMARISFIRKILDQASN
jgi:hypothetical protein